ncbi:MAG: class I SAM-dependent methyltransferase [Candidatus Paceibacterota bacterium]
MITKENTIVFPAEYTEEEKQDLQICKAEGHLLDVLRYFRKVIVKDKNNEATILDVGCRDDTTRPFFIKQGFNWMGIDIHPNCNSVMKGDMNDLPFAGESINFVFCSHALEHTERPMDVLRELKRVAKLNGYIFLATPAYSEYQLFSCDKEHVNVPTMWQMRKWAYHLGLEVVHQTYVKNIIFEDRLASLITLLRVINK